MTEEQKEIKKWSNEQKVEALAKFVALKSGDPRKALLYGFMLDCLLDEINKGQNKIEKLKNQNKLASKEHKERFNELEAETEKKDKIIDEMAKSIVHNNDIDYEICENVHEQEIECEGYSRETNESCEKCVKQYFEKKVEGE